MTPLIKKKNQIVQFFLYTMIKLKKNATREGCSNFYTYL